MGWSLSSYVVAASRKVLEVEQWDGWVVPAGASPGGWQQYTLVCLVTLADPAGVAELGVGSRVSFRLAERLLPEGGELERDVTGRGVVVGRDGRTVSILVDRKDV